MNAEWYYKKNGQPVGPITIQQLKHHVANGTLVSSSLVKTEEMKGWTLAGHIEGLFRDADLQDRPPPLPQSGKLVITAPEDCPPPLPKSAELDEVSSAQVSELSIATDSDPLADIYQSFNGTTRRSSRSTARKGGTSISSNPILIYGSLVLCFPVGLYFAWTHPQWTNAKKWSVSGVWGLIMLLGLFGSQDMRKAHGPNGESILVGGDGLGSDWFFHYYVDKDGKQIQHGTSKVQFNGTGSEESNYDNGVLLSRRSSYDSKESLVKTFARLADGTYQEDEYSLQPDGSTLHLRSIINIAKTDDGETHKRTTDKQVVSDDKPLQSVSGRQLNVKVNTVCLDATSWWIKDHNASIISANCIATLDNVVIDFDTDSSKWTPLGQSLPMLVRLFDKNGQYLNHFTTAEGFTVFPQLKTQHDTIYQRFIQNGGNTEFIRENAAPFKCVLLKPTGNRLVYPVNVRDLRDVSAVEIGFIARPQYAP